MYYKQLLIFSSLILLVQQVALSQDVKVDVSVKKVIETGENFRLAYTVNSQVDDFAPPALKGFDRLAGPSVSSQSSFQFINGKASQSVSTIYSYILRAQKSGTYTIPPATVTVGKKKYSSIATQVEVIGENSTPSNEQNNADKGSSTINTNKDFFLRVNLSKTKIYQGEQIIATTTVYVSDQIGYGGTKNQKLPTFQGFWKKNLDLNNRLDFKKKRINNKNFNVAVLSQSIISPQRSGEFKIEPGEITSTIGVGYKGRDFWGRELYREVFDKTVKSNAPKVTVMALPFAGKPASFTGAVGNYTMTASCSSTNVNANDAVTIFLKIKGQGDIRLVENPKIDFPAVFELYDPKPQVNVNNTLSGTQGVVSFEYLALAREPGDYHIPPIEFSYFDPHKRKYNIIKSQAFDIHVEKGENDANYSTTLVDKEDLKIFSSDILHIDETKMPLKKTEQFLFGSTIYISFFVGFLLIFAIVFVLKRKQIELNNNVALAKNRKANKIIQKRLKKAKKYMADNQQAEFYTEILTALWTYLSDKLNIPNVELNKENITQNLMDKGLKTEQTEQMIQLIDRCEFARYAPAISQHSTQDIYDATANIIRYIEQNLKK